MSAEPHEPADAELVDLVLHGQHEAFGILYDRYARLARAIAGDAGGDWSTVQDLTQETFLRAFRSLPTLRDKSRFGPWLAGIARQVVLERRRSRPFALLPQELAHAEAPPGVDAADEIAVLLRQVARLPEEQREAVRHYFLSQRNADETARAMGRSRSGVYALLKQACLTLAEWMGASAEDKR